MSTASGVFRCAKAGRRAVGTRRTALAAVVAAALWLGSGGGLLGVPASMDLSQVWQPDGTLVTLRLRGDEFFSWHETEAGFAVVRNEADGWWYYAVPTPDGTRFTPTSAQAGLADPAASGLTPGLVPPLAGQSARAKARTGALPPGAQAPADKPGLAPPHGRVPAEGTVRNIVILACFSDHWNAGASTVNATYGRPPGDYTNLFNTVGYSTDGAAGSVRDYFSEVSYSKLTISSVVTNWVLLPNNEAYYGANDAWGNDLRPDVMVADAISAADTAGFDFSQGDGDGDGWVDIFTVIHSGLDEAYGGNPANCIWSHQGAMSSVVTVDGVNYFRYNTNPAHRGNSTTGITRIGVVCHEMTHFLGLPDLYDYSNTTYGTGTWCLMGSGSWGAGWTLSTAHRPVHMSAWCKYALGFLRPTDIHSQTSLSLPRVETNASAP